MDASERIWYEDPRSFVEPDHLIRFFPIRRMTYAEQLNAILRFTIYFTLIVIITGRSTAMIFLPIGTALLTFLMYKSQNLEGLGEEIMRSDDTVTSDDTSAKTTTKTTRKESSLTHNATKIKKKQCQDPTKENPFMNVLMNEYVDRPKRPKACDIQDTRVKEKAERLFTKANSGLVRESDDVYHRKASSRQFVTNPITSIPNDQTNFAKWLYHSPPECKTKHRSKCSYRI